MNLLAQVIPKVVTIEKQTINELERDNAEFINWLREYYDKDTEERFINYLKTELSFVPKDGTTIELPLIKIGNGSLFFYPYTTEVKYGRAKDPINLIFYRNGSDLNVRGKMCNNLNPAWANAPGFTQYTFIDDTQHGGNVDWVKVKHSLSDKPGKSGFFTTRKHIRIFCSGEKCNHPGGYGDYSLASVHEDPPVWHSHPLDFDNSQSYVENAFIPLAKTISHVVLQPQQIINTVQHDGIATAIEI